MLSSRSINSCNPKRDSSRIIILIFNDDESRAYPNRRMQIKCEKILENYWILSVHNEFFILLHDKFLKFVSAISDF